jgi:hypothetical protein
MPGLEHGLLHSRFIFSMLSFAGHYSWFALINWMMGVLVFLGMALMSFGSNTK